MELMFAQSIDAMDGTHVCIKKPSFNVNDFINKKGHYTLKIYAFADCNYCFLDVVIKWPGSLHETQMFSNSSLDIMLKDGTISRCSKFIG